MKPRIHRIRTAAALCLLGMACSASAGTIAYWRFEGDGTTVPTAGTQVEDTNGRTTITTGVGVRAVDVTGNGNTMWSWEHAWAGHTYETNLPGNLSYVPSTGQSNAFSLKNAGSYPGMFTWPAMAPPTGTNINTWTSTAWTIEAYVYSSALDGYRTLVCREGNGVAGVDGSLAPLYLQKVPDGRLVIKFADAAGNWHEAYDTTSMVLNKWYAVAATSDGATLKLYKNSFDGNGYVLVGSKDISGSTNPALVNPGNDNTGNPWGWVIFRGRYGNNDAPDQNHGDRWFGGLDEVRISDTALAPADMLASLNTGDGDGDGLPDSWEVITFGNLGQTGTGDPDNDGHTNLAEYTANSNPTVQASVPGDIDGDGLSDTWEMTHYTNLTTSNGTADPDGDLATDALEAGANTNPNNADSWPDTDADGMNDAWESAYFTDLSKTGAADTDTDGYTDLEEFVYLTNPTVATFSPPWTALRHRWSFNGDLTDSVGGSNASIIDIGTTSNATLGANAITLDGGDKTTSDYVRLGSNLLKGIAHPVTLEFWATQNSVMNWSRMFDFHGATNESLHLAWTNGTNIATDQVEWVDPGGPAVYNTNQPFTAGTQYHIVMTIEPAAGTDGKTKVTWYSAPAADADLGAARGNFETTNNLVNFNDLNDAIGFSPWPDATANAAYDEIRIWNGALRGYAREELHDNGPDNAVNADADADGLPDAWETANLLSTASGTGTDGPDGDPDGDLTSNRQELLLGTDPQDPMSNAADTDADGLPDAWEITYFGTITAQNGAGDPDGDHATNAEELAAVTNPTLVTSFPDTDTDGLSDGWEMFYFTDLDETGTGDTDGDGFTNVAEQTAASSPLDPLIPGATDGDGDNDGLDDRWEVLHFTNIVSQNGIGDPDNDSANNLAEYKAMSDPNVAASTPTDVNGDTVPDTVSFMGFDTAGTGLLDKDGEATGFTHRLANTGTDPSFSPNDPNLDLDTAAGTLAITSTNNDVNGQFNMAVAEMLGINLSSLGFTGSQDFKLRAKFVNLPATSNADQLGIFAGASSTSLIRGGRIDVKNTFGTNTNGNNDSNSVFAGAADHLAATRSATVEMSRVAGVWSLSINGMTVTPGAQPAFLDALPDLTVGVLNADLFSNTRKTAYLDSFTAVVLTNPSPDGDGDGMDDTWEIANFGTVGAQNGGGDPDGDGATNLEEFAFNGNPNNGSDQGHAVGTRGDSNGNGRADFTLTIAVRAGATFAAGPNGTQTATVNGITYTVRGSEDLAAFNSPVTWVSSAASGSPDYELHTFRLDVSDAVAPAAKGFLQATVSAP
ncbi:MAG: laminin G domain-containing protein [Verrucomicrobia bacterium]|nr:laminin G domain-containing protein [Verrucomicrobiota bacterium]